MMMTGTLINNDLESVYQRLLKIQNQIDALQQQVNGTLLADHICAIIQKEYLEKILDATSQKNLANVFQQSTRELIEAFQQADSFEILDSVLDDAIIEWIEDESSDIYKRIKNIINVLIKKKVNGL